MANGYCEALLLHLESIAGTNYPGKKVTVPGFLNMLISQSDRPFAAANVGGHYKDVRVKYMPRTITSQVSITDTCSVDFVPANLSALRLASLVKSISVSSTFAPNFLPISFASFGTIAS